MVKTSSICFPFTHSVAAKKKKIQIRNILNYGKHEVPIHIAMKEISFSFNKIKRKTLERERKNNKKTKNSNTTNAQTLTAKHKLETNTNIN